MYKFRRSGTALYALLALIGLASLGVLDVAQSHVRMEHAAKQVTDLEELIALSGASEHQLRTAVAHLSPRSNMRERFAVVGVLTAATRNVEAMVLGASSAAASVAVVRKDLDETSRTAGAISVATIAAQSTAGAHVDATQALNESSVAKLQNACRLALNTLATARLSVVDARRSLAAAVPSTAGGLRPVWIMLSESIGDDSFFSVMFPLGLGLLVALAVLGIGHFIKRAAQRAGVPGEKVEPVSLPVAAISAAVVAPFVLTPLLLGSALPAIAKTGGGNADLGRVAGAIEALNRDLTARTTTALLSAQQAVASLDSSQRRVAESVSSGFTSTAAEVGALRRPLNQLDSDVAGLRSDIRGVGLATDRGWQGLQKMEEQHQAIARDANASLAASTVALRSIETAVKGADHNVVPATTLLAKLNQLEQCQVAKSRSQGFFGSVADVGRWFAGRLPSPADSLSDDAKLVRYVENHCR